MANLTVDVPWQIATEGVTVIGNDSNRFEVHQQTGTLGPEPGSEMDGPPEKRGSFAPSPRAS